MFSGAWSKSGIIQRIFLWERSPDSRSQVGVALKTCFLSQAPPPPSQWTVAKICTTLVLICHEFSRAFTISNTTFPILDHETWIRVLQIELQYTKAIGFGQFLSISLLRVPSNNEDVEKWSVSRYWVPSGGNRLISKLWVRQRLCSVLSSRSAAVNLASLPEFPRPWPANPWASPVGSKSQDPRWVSSTTAS